MRARKRPYLPRLDRSLELFARLSRHLGFFNLLRRLGWVGDLCLLYLWNEYCLAERATSHNNCLYWWITYINNECIVVFLVQFTHAVRFDHLVVYSRKDLVDLWGGPLLCGPNPTSQYGQGSDNSFCEPGLPWHLQKCRLFSHNHSGWKLVHYFSSQTRGHMNFVFVLFFL